MTIRAVLIGLLGAVAICAFGFFNDMMMRGTFLVGNYMPISVYGLLLAFLLLMNPLLLFTGRLRSRLAAGVISALFAGLAAGGISGLVAGLLAGPTTGLIGGAVAGVLVGAGVAGLIIVLDGSGTSGPFKTPNDPSRASGPFNAPNDKGAVPGLRPTKRLRPAKAGRKAGLAGAFVGILVGGLVTGVAAGSGAGFWWGVIAALIAGPVAGAVAGLGASRLVLSGRELAVIVALILPACYVPGRGLMHYFTTVLMMPHHYERTDPGWQEQAVVKMAPEVMLAGVSPRLREEDILDPRGLSARLVADGEGPSSGPGRRIWALLSEEEREAVRAGLRRALLGPDESWRPRAQDACEAALKRRRGRRRRQEQEEAQREGEPPGEPEPSRDNGDGPAGASPSRLSPADRKSFRDAVDAALLPPGPDSPSSLETVRALDSRMAELGFSPEERELVTRVVGEAHSEAEAPCRRALARALGGLLDRRGFYSQPDFEGVILPKEAAQIMELGIASLRHEKVRRLNRHLIDSAYPKEITSLVSRKNYAVDGFVQGLGIGTKRISFWQIPWYAWLPTLFRFWLPLLLLFSFAVIGLALVVHRQWSDHEHVAYPIVTFARSLLPEGGGSRGSVFRNRMFWMAMCAVLFIHLNNYAYRWWPQQLVEIPRRFDFMSLVWGLDNWFIRAFRRGGVWLLFNPTIFFTAIGFAYFVPSDVSLSLGLAAFVYAFVAGVFAGYGVSFGGGGFMSTRIEGSIFAGAYFGMFLFLIYTGRHYYSTVFRRSLLLPAKDRAEPSAVWGARVFMVCAAMFALVLVSAGLGWQWAVLYTLGSVLLYVVMSRVVAETGMFFIHAYWFPGVLIWSFLGAKALGPQAMLIMFLVSCVLLIDPREAVMPFAVHAIKLADATGARVGRTALWGGVALGLGLAVAIPIVLYLQYSVGATAVGDGWTMNVPKFTFNAIVNAKQRLAAQGALSEAGRLPASEWFGGLTPNKGSVTAFFVMVALVLLFAAGRLRFARWPLHPVLFVALGSWQSRCLAVSFLIGWFIKVMVTKYGGAGVYQRLKPLMIGLIAGDMLGGIIPMAIGAIYYFATGEIPKGFRVLPT